MTPNTLATLLLPFAKGHLPMPGPGRALFLRAEPGPGLDAAWRAAIVAEHASKPAVDRLHRAGFTLHDAAGGAFDEAIFDAALVPVTKDKHETFGLIERAWRALVPGGVLVVAGEKALGALSIERALAQLHPIEGGLPKHGCRVVWLRKGEMRAPFETALQAWRDAAMPQRRIAETFVTMPGLFSWTGIDPGSRLLADHLPPLAGAIADLGAGWGYLARRILDEHPDVTALDLYEADRNALACAEANLAETAGTAGRRFHWHDVTAGLIAGAAYDAIVTNPPFHDGRAGDPALGQAFITAAHGGLRRGGRLVLVANRHLPYEAALTRLFGGLDLLAETDRYKVVTATRR